MIILFDIFIFLFNQNLLLIAFFSLLSSTQARSVIYLNIKGKGVQNIINNTFKYNPSAVYVKGNLNSTCTKSCYLGDTDGVNNNITLIFNNQIETCANMFSGLSNIQEIDLSNFDTSLVTNMYSMFNGCTSLQKLNFNNINTSLVQNMRYLFYKCY